ncbi:MAG: hypothetical protein AAGD11_14320 [Planctomycetota bacterium]
MKEMLPSAAVGVGVFLLLAGLLWSSVFPASNAWTDEKAQRMSELTGKVHKLLFKSVAAKEQRGKGRGVNPTEAKAEYDQAKAELEKLRTEFESARDNPKTAGNYLRYAGTGLVLLGGFGVMLARSG